MIKKINILFTSVGRRVELINAWKESIKEINMKIDIIGVDMDPLAPALQVVDKKYIVPSLDSPNFVNELVKICEKEDIGLIFPLIDPDILMLSKNRRRIEKTGALCSILSDEAIQITSNKVLTSKFLDSINIPIPKLYDENEINNNEIMYPVFLKPNQGSGSKGASKINNRIELEFYSDRSSSPIIQEYLTGQEITNDVVCDFDGKLLAIVSRARIDVRSGEVLKGKTITDLEIRKYCKIIAKKLHVNGPITVQCIFNNGKPYFTEINARFGGGIPLSFQAGANIPKWLLCKFLDLPVKIPKVGTYINGLYISRYDSAFYLSNL